MLRLMIYPSTKIWYQGSACVGRVEEVLALVGLLERRDG
jgi:hypothetical protein